MVPVPAVPPCGIGKLSRDNFYACSVGFNNSGLIRLRVRHRWFLWGIANICGFRIGHRRHQVRQLFSGSPDLSLIETAYLFRYCQTDEMIEGEPFSTRKVGGSLEDRRR